MPALKGPTPPEANSLSYHPASLGNGDGFASPVPDFMRLEFPNSLFLAFWGGGRIFAPLEGG